MQNLSLSLRANEGRVSTLEHRKCWDYLTAERCAEIGHALAVVDETGEERDLVVEEGCLGSDCMVCVCTAYIRGLYWLLNIRRNARSTIIFLTA